MNIPAIFGRCLKAVIPALCLTAVCAGTTSCSDDKSYADLLTEENHYVNNFLADQRVINEIPADNKFEYGEDAPYYRIDDDGALYMQVLKPGTPGDTVSYDELIYFRYTSYELSQYANGKLPVGIGNNTALTPAWFRYGNFSLQSSYSFGQGIQRPLAFLPIDCEVNLVVKSTVGWADNIAEVQPYLYTLTYSRPIL